MEEKLDHHQWLRAVKELYSTNEAPVDESISQAIQKVRSAKILQRADALVLDDVMRFLEQRGSTPTG